VNNTPRTDEQINGKTGTRFAILVGDSLRDALVPSEFCRQLERELNAANAIIRQQQLLEEENLRLQERIKRLEEALDTLTLVVGLTPIRGNLAALQEAMDQSRAVLKAKEDKP